MIKIILQEDSHEKKWNNKYLFNSMSWFKYKLFYVCTKILLMSLWLNSGKQPKDYGKSGFQPKLSLSANNIHLYGKKKQYYISLESDTGCQNVLHHFIIVKTEKSAYAHRTDNNGHSLKCLNDLHSFL